MTPNKSKRFEPAIPLLDKPLILRKKQVIKMVGLSASTLRNLQLAGTFPLPIRPSPRTVAWITQDIEEWLAKRAKDRAA